MNIKAHTCALPAILGVFLMGTQILATTAPVQAQPASQLDYVKSPAAGAPITITVPAGARQKFAGLGTSLGNWGGEFQKLPAEQQDALSKMLWQGLKFKTLRMWFNTDEYAPTVGAHDLTPFKRMYVDSGIIAQARKYGLQNLLLGPAHFPKYMRDTDGKHLKPSETDNYAILLADFLQCAKAETGIEIGFTGIQNEPNDLMSAAQIVQVVKKLRSELDARGLKNTKIIASEHANNDDWFYKQVAALKADPQAWDAIVGIASHSYGMASTDQGADQIAGPNGENLKEYWMTESSENGAEEPGDVRRAILQAARFLNDMNHRTTHWLHFLGFETADPKDNATRIIAYTTSPVSVTVFKKYYVYQQLANAFDIGARFRDSQSSLEGDMTFTYGQKPRLIAATAQNPDGSWSIGLSNYTANSFKGVQGWGDENWNVTQGGTTPAQTFPVTVQIEELKTRKSVPFTVYRTNVAQDNVKGEKVTMKNGVVTLNVAPQELVTLRSSGD